MVHIDNHEIDSENSVTVLGIKIDTTPCQKAGRHTLHFKKL